MVQVTIDEQFDAATDVLVYPFSSVTSRRLLLAPPASISAVYSPLSGSLSLSGNASQEDYSVALRLVAFNNVAQVRSAHTGPHSRVLLW